MDVFISAGSGGLSSPRGISFGPDGHIYVVSHNTNAVLRYNGSSGEFIDVFADGGDPNGPLYLTFSHDGSHLFVSSVNDHRVLRYNSTTGEYVDDFVPSGDHRGE